MFNFLLEDENGNRFFVQADRMDEVVVTLEENFPDGIECSLIGVYNDDEAEAMGYDTF